MQIKETTVPGKILFYGGYSVLLKDHISLSIAVVDKEGKGVTARYKESEDARIISKQFSLNFEPSWEEREITSFAYKVAEAYLKEKGLLKTQATIELENSPIFGTKEEKSGLGSSAAVTVAVVKALLDVNEINNNDLVHKLSQIAYAYYSGKIGSGFDIATSTAGKTIVYYRYNPEMIKMPENEEYEKAVIESVERKWEWLKIIPFEWPEEYKLLVYNIKGGKRSTISAVKAWKGWKKKDEKTFKELMEKQNEIEKMAIEALKNRNSEKIREYTREARKIHRKMQEEIAKVVEDFEKIEPEELTKLIDEAEKIDGVVAGRCPGAGGKDSVAFIVRKDFESDGEIEKIAERLNLTIEKMEVRVL